MCGASLLVIPQESGVSFAKIYLPQGDWYNAYTGERSSGGQEKLIELTADRLPVFVKAGSIIPRQSVVQSTSEAPSDTLDLHVYQGKEANSFVYYEDDGATYAYEKGGFYQRTIYLDPASRTLTLDKPEGALVTHYGHIRLLLHGFDDAKLRRGQAMVATKDEYNSFLPGGDNQPETAGNRVKTVVLVNDNQAMSLSY
jgi:alpha-glucosidase